MLSTIIKTALSSLRFRVCRCRFRRHECGRHLRVAEFLLGVSAGSFQPGHTISFSIQLDSNAQLQVFLQWVLEIGGCNMRAGNILNLLRTHRNPSLSNAPSDCRDPASRRALASTNTAETAPTPRPHNRQERDEEPLKVGFSNILKSISGTRTRKLASIRILRTANNIIVWGWHSITPRICNDACARG